MLQPLSSVEVSFVSALVGVGCASLLHLFGCCLLVATATAVPSSHHYRRFGRARRRHLDHRVGRAVIRSRLGAVYLRFGRVLPDGLFIRRAVSSA